MRQGSGLDAQITVEVPQLQFLAKVDVLVQRQVLWSKQCRTLFGSPQLQLLDKVIDVPVMSTTRARGGLDSAVLGQECGRAQCCARQVLVAVQTEQFCTCVDVHVVAHDMEMPQIQFFARV